MFNNLKNNVKMVGLVGAIALGGLFNPIKANAMEVEVLEEEVIEIIEEETYNFSDIEILEEEVIEVIEEEKIEVVEEEAVEVIEEEELNANIGHDVNIDHKKEGGRKDRDYVNLDEEEVVEEVIQEEKPNKGQAKPEEEVETEEIIEEELNNVTFIDDHIAYLQGYTDGSIRAEGNMTRAEFSAVIYRLLDSKYKTNGNVKFNDVDNNAWYAKYISTLSNNGIITGYEDGTFRPDDKITRAELATMIARFQNLKGGNKTFTDINNHWAKANIQKVTNKGWMNGYKDGSFKPNQYITRAEVATTMNRVLVRSVDKKDIPNNIVKFNDLQANAWYYENIVEATNEHDFKIDGNKEVWTQVHKISTEM